MEQVSAGWLTDLLTWSGALRAGRVAAVDAPGEGSDNAHLGRLICWHGNDG